MAKGKSKKTNSRPDTILSSDESAFAQKLSSRLSSVNAAPVLFVGAGLSKRYLGLPSWEDLLKELSVPTGKDYEYYRSAADGDSAETATLLAEPLRELLWTSAYSETKENNKHHLTKRESALKVLVAERTLALKHTTDPILLEELKLLRKVVVDAVITTNYDQFIEDIFPNYQVFVGQDELLFSDPKGVGEIYKIHGSVSDPNSLVITTEDYREYTARNPYLAAKLLTLFAEHPVVFIGYSMNDPNVTQILESLVSCLRPEHISKIKDRIFFVHWDKRKMPTIENTVIQIQGTNLPVVSMEVSNFTGLYTALGSIKRKFNAHTLRRLKEHVYDLILTNDPKGLLHVVHDLEDESENQPDVVVGVGAITALGKYGYRPISRTDILLDILHDRSQYDSSVILQDTVSTFPMRQKVPHIKYMMEAGYINKEGELLKSNGLHPAVIERFNQGATPFLPSDGQKRQALSIATKAGNFKELIKSNDFHHVMLALPELQPSEIMVSDLKKYLIAHEEEAIEEGKSDTGFAKSVCLYERLKYLSNPW